MTKKRSPKPSSDSSHAEGVFTVQNDKGLHTRPSTELVKLTAKFKSLILLKTRDYEVNAKSLLGILTLAATKGTKIKIVADGPDAQEAVDAIIQLASQNFHMRF